MAPDSNSITVVSHMLLVLLYFQKVKEKKTYIAKALGVWTMGQPYTFNIGFSHLSSTWGILE